MLRFTLIKQFFFFLRWPRSYFENYSPCVQEKYGMDSHIGEKEFLLSTDQSEPDPTQTDIRNFCVKIKREGLILRPSGKPLPTTTQTDIRCFFEKEDEPDLPIPPPPILRWKPKSPNSARTT